MSYGYQCSRHTPRKIIYPLKKYPHPLKRGGTIILNTMSEKSTQRRKDRVGEHRTTYEKNRRRILISQDRCAICGRPVNKSLKTPDPNAPEIDHIIPISLGGHPSDISNLQLVHSACNKAKSNKIPTPPDRERTNGVQWTTDWLSYRG